MSYIMEEIKHWLVFQVRRFVSRMPWCEKEFKSLQKILWRCFILAEVLGKIFSCGFGCVFQLFTISLLTNTGIQIRQRSKLTAIFFAFPQEFNTDYSNVSRIKPPHCFAGGAVKQNDWGFVFIADNLLYFHKHQHFSTPFVCVNLSIFSV